MTAAVLRRLGLLGGMGPSATLDVLQKLIAETDASSDQEHVPVVVWSVPQIPDRSSSLASRGPSPAPRLAASAHALRAAGADFIGIACNTAHHWHEVVRSASRLPVLHIADVVIEALARSGVRRGRVVVLGTDGTLASGFYQRRLQAAGFSPVLPDPSVQSAGVMRAIALAKAARWSEAASAASIAADHVTSRSPDAVLLACTELPLVLPSAGMTVPVVDANRALARACIRYSGAALRPESAR